MPGLMNFITRCTPLLSRESPKYSIRDDDLCSYFWDDSPWLKQFYSEMAEVCEVGKLAHHVLLGGDYNIEILALGDAKFVPIERRADNGK
jgi:hypothetical protein